MRSGPPKSKHRRCKYTFARNPLWTFVLSCSVKQSNRICLPILGSYSPMYFLVRKRTTMADNKQKKNWVKTRSLLSWVVRLEDNTTPDKYVITVNSDKLKLVLTIIKIGSPVPDFPTPSFPTRTKLTWTACVASMSNSLGWIPGP